MNTEELNIESLADCTAAEETFKGTPEEAEKSEAYRVFNTQEEFQSCIDRALGKRLSKLREQSEELDSLKPLMSKVLGHFNLKSKEELEKLVSEEDTQNSDEDMSADELQKKLTYLAQNEDEVYGTEQAESLLANERFKTLIRNGFSVKEAFDTVNLSKILKSQRESVKDEVIREIRIRGLRPSEDAVSGYGSFSATINPKNLTDSQREEIRERVRRGERVTF